MGSGGILRDVARCASTVRPIHVSAFCFVVVCRGNFGLFSFFFLFTARHLFSIFFFLLLLHFGIDC